MTATTRMAGAPTLEQVDALAQRYRDDLARRQAAIENDKTLSVEGRRSKLDSVTSERREKQYEIDRKWDAARLATQERLHVRAFQSGIGSIDSYRPLFAQASELDAKGLAELKRRAQNTNDSLLLKAVYQASYDQGLLGLLDDAPAAVQALLDHEFETELRPDLDRARQLERRLARNMRLRV